MTDTTPRGQTESLAFDFDLRHPPAKVWRALTDEKLVSQWLLPAVNFKLAPGSAFQFTAPPQPGWDGLVHCQCLKIEPQKSLRWRWLVGDLDTTVTFTLTPTEGGSRLSLVQ